MEIPSTDNTPACRRMAIEVLLQGFEFAKQFQILLSESSSGDKGASMYPSSGDLLEMISNSFSRAIAVLSNVESNEVNQAPANVSGLKSEDSEGSSKSSTTVINRRRDYKRKKTEGTWTRDNPNWVDDGHAWRKYGQKGIRYSKYQRHYYRCSYKSDGCPATKQVQQIRDNPPMYRTTYQGKHTCQDLLNSSQILMEDHDSAADSSVFLSFDNSNSLTNNQQYNNNANPFFSSCSSLSIKQKHIVDHHNPVVQRVLTPNQSASSDYLLSPDELTAFGSPLSSDIADFISCTATTHHNFDMGSIDCFEDDVLKQYGGLSHFEIVM